MIEIIKKVKLMIEESENEDMESVTVLTESELRRYGMWLSHQDGMTAEKKRFFKF